MVRRRMKTFRRRVGKNHFWGVYTMKRRHAKKQTTYNDQKARIRVGQSASSRVTQNGNAISVNAVDIAVVRVNPGQQGAP